MKYKNPRLKHVKKIKDILTEMPMSVQNSEVESILDQCNLLLETKKVNKQKLPKHYALLNKAVRRWLEGGHTHDNNDPLKPSPQPEETNKGCCGLPQDHLVRESDGVCARCGAKLSPQPEIEPQKPLGNPDISRSVEYVGDCIKYAVNKLTKTK